MVVHARALAIVALLATSGCDVVFGLADRTIAPDAPSSHVDATAAYDRCGPFLYDDPGRYAAIHAPVADVPWAWEDARTACRQRGMDLAVLNDAHELGMAPETAGPTFWIGEQRTETAVTTVDGCPSAIGLGTARVLAPAGPSSCGLVNVPSEVVAAACTGELPPETAAIGVLDALCETPRPADATCLGGDPGTERYVASPGPLSYAEAITFCTAQHGHPIVLETTAEWHHVSALVGTQVMHTFWIGSRFDGARWTTDNSCPAVYPWANGGPLITGAPACASALIEGIVTEENPNTLTPRLQGAQTSACDDGATYALCEIEH